MSRLRILYILYHKLGYLYVLVPVGLGTVIMLAIALLVNNIPASRKYPEFWF